MILSVVFTVTKTLIGILAIRLDDSFSPP